MLEDALPRLLAAASAAQQQGGAAASAAALSEGAARLHALYRRLRVVGALGPLPQLPAQQRAALERWAEAGEGSEGTEAGASPTEALTEALADLAEAGAPLGALLGAAQRATGPQGQVRRAGVGRQVRPPVCQPTL